MFHYFPLTHPPKPSTPRYPTLLLFPSDSPSQTQPSILHHLTGTSFEERMSQLRQLEIEAEHIRQEVLVHRYDYHFNLNL